MVKVEGNLVLIQPTVTPGITVITSCSAMTRFSRSVRSAAVTDGARGGGRERACEHLH